MATGEWFVIKGGEDKGKWHMAGWYLSAFSVLGFGPHPDKLVGYGTCPRCGAMVICDDAPGKGDFTWRHEEWHHKTDYPHPEKEAK
jgi:hypothetical protein